jgi:tetratricopeptide (TPR) repeat protein
MSNDGVSPEDQAAISQVARSVMQKLAAGQSAEDIARELHTGGWQKSTADGLVEHVEEDWRKIEAAPLANAGLYLQMKYPEMKPVGAAPTLQTVHGIGTCFYGARDHDRATGTYVKTQCFCAFFFPLVAMKSYRVRSQGSGWNLIGRVPLSRLAKTWNIAVVCAILGCITVPIIAEYLNNPSHRAARTLAKADEAAEAGNLLEAGRLYCDVVRTRTEHAFEARQRCAKLIERPEVDALSLADATRLFDDVVETRLLGDSSPADVTRGIAMVKSHAQADPVPSTRLLNRIARLSSADAYREFAELVQGPFAALPPAATVNVFREAALIPQEGAQKTGMVQIGIKQCQRLSASDLPAAFELLAILAPQGNQPAIEKCLAELLGPPLEKAPAAQVAGIIRLAAPIAGPDGSEPIFKAGLSWVEHHAQPPDAKIFDILDQLAALPGADLARVAAIRRPLLEKLVAANPQDVDLTVKLALALEAEGHSAAKKAGDSDDSTSRIVKLLSPLHGKLGTGEGARVLGQALAAQNRFDEAYALLSPYMETHLDAFHEASQAYISAIEQAQDRVVEQIRRRNAPGFNYNLFENLPDDKKGAMVDDYINQHMKDDPAIDAARQRLSEQSMVVPAALDLGMVTLQRAQTQRDPAARRADLERAEKTFLAIRGTAAESDKYMLHLGQVYYWLGKQKEGQEEFDKFLAKHARNPEVLYALASILRDLGAFVEARKYLEEAYDKAPDEKVKKGVAELRAITFTDLDDKIHWLERCDANHWNVKALLAETRGSRAQNQGKDDEAAADYREAVALYENRPQTSDVLNNGALANLSLFEVSGDRQALQRCSQWLEKAVSISPMDSLVLGNAATSILRAAVQDLAGTRLNLRDLQMSGRITALTYLAADQAGLDALRRQAREHAGIRKGLSYLERAIVLAPKSIENIETALEFYGFLRDREALERLAGQVAASKPDVSESVTQRLKYYHYQDEESTKEGWRSSMAKAEALVSRLRAGDKGVEYAAAAAMLVGLKQSVGHDPELNPDELVQLAEGAHRAAPSMATSETMVQALLARAAKKLAAQYPEFDQATQGTARAASAGDAVALAMGRSDALGKSARENPDVERAIALVATRAEAFPETKGMWAWILLGAAQPSRAELRAQCLAPDEVSDLQRQIQKALMPIDPNNAFHAYWKRLAAGTANAREPLDDLIKLGVPLPVGLIEEPGEK